MKAAVYYGVNDVRIEERSKPRLRADEILIRVKACGICTSDFRSVKIRKSSYIIPPRILGHEIAGEIVEIGSDVKGFEEGMRVVIAPGVGCGECAYCLTGRDNLCRNRLVIGANLDGGFAEYVKLPSTYLRGVIPFPKNLTFEEAALTEPLSCCLHGILRANVRIGDTVVILGAGPIGLLHLQLAKAMGAKKVIVSEAVKRRIELARRFGAEVINFKEIDPVQAVKDLTNGEKADKVIVAVGDIQAISQGLNMVKDAGTLVIFGGVPPGSQISLDPNLIHYSEINVTGSIDSTIAEFKKALELISNRIIDVKPLISHIISLDNIMMGFELMERKESIKVIVKP